MARARQKLAEHPRGIAGGLDGWASLCGNIPKARLAIRFLLATNEAEVVTVDGKRVYRRRGAAPEADPPEPGPSPQGAICDTCNALRGTGEGQCDPCGTCGGCLRALPQDGGCPC